MVKSSLPLLALWYGMYAVLPTAPNGGHASCALFLPSNAGRVLCCMADVLESAAVRGAYRRKIVGTVSDDEFGMADG